MPKCARREARQLPLTGKTQGRTKQLRGPGSLTEEIRRARCERGKSCPAVDTPEKMRVQRARLTFVIMRKEFGAIGGDIHVGGTFGFAGLAGEAKVQSFFDVLILPGVANHFALQQLE